MQFEVEQKFGVADLAELAARLEGLGARTRDAIRQVDRYFAHPARDFAQTDEALRIRQVGDLAFITYKGPKLDQATKTRREIELPLAAGSAVIGSWTLLLESLGFRPVAEVCKQRQCMDLMWSEAAFEVALDQVEHVGSFVELELLADESSLDAARACVQALAARLGLVRAERRSYLELLLEARAKS